MASMRNKPKTYKPFKLAPKRKKKEVKAGPNMDEVERLMAKAGWVEEQLAKHYAQRDKLADDVAAKIKLDDAAEMLMENRLHMSVSAYHAQLRADEQKNKGKAAGEAAAFNKKPLPRSKRQATATGINYRLVRNTHGNSVTLSLAEVWDMGRSAMISQRSILLVSVDRAIEEYDEADAIARLRDKVNELLCAFAQPIIEQQKNVL